MSIKIRETLRRTLIARIHKLGPSKPVEITGESPAPAKVSVWTSMPRSPGEKSR
jgi:hypothetical protein